jgi:hypothetical protein
MSYPVYGPGTVIITRTDIPGCTPINCGNAQEFSLDESAEEKALFGGGKYSLANATGTVKASGKIKSAEFSGIAVNSMFYGGTFTTGKLVMAVKEAITVPAVAPYTVSPANAANFDTDLGILYAETGLPFALSTVAPVKGSYEVSEAGEYTFAAADAGAQLLVTYAWKNAASGQSMTVMNTPIGTNPTFQIDYFSEFEGQIYYARVWKATCSKLARAHKLTDYMMPELDFSYGADKAGRVVTFSSDEVS